MAQRLLKNSLPLFFIFLVFFSLCVSKPESAIQENVTNTLPTHILQEEVPFKVGQKFTYEGKTTKNGEIYGKYSNIYSVEKIGKINNESFFVVSNKFNASIFKPSDYLLWGEDVYYYDTDTGKIFKYIGLASEPPSSQLILFGKEAELQMIRTSEILFAPWMLNLSDGFTYEGLNYSVRVVGKERINGEPCFKVEIIAPDRRIYLWVSIEDAISLKVKKQLDKTVYEAILVKNTFHKDLTK